MSKPARSFVRPAAVVAGAILVASAAILWQLSRAGEAERSALRRAAMASDARLEPLAARLRQDEDHIAALEARIAELEERLGALASTQAAPDAVPSVAEVEPPDGEPDAASAPDLDAAAWLEKLFPERFASLSGVEARYLRDLDLRDTRMTGADLEHLAALTSLRSLSLRGTALSDADLVHLQGLGQLRTLELRGTAITGAGLSYLPPGLEELDLTDTRLTEENLYRLPRLPALRSIDLNRLPLGDAAVEVLGRYPSLRMVELDSTGITDAGLRRLLELNPALERLELRGAKTTPATIRELAEAYPGLTSVLQ